MGAFCEIALALGLTFGGLCEPPAEGEKPTLPGDDEAAWRLSVPPPEAPPRAPSAPALPPVVVTKVVQMPAPAPPPPPPAAPPVRRAPPPPDPFRVALETALSYPTAMPIEPGTWPGEANPSLQMASLPGVEATDGTETGGKKGYEAERRTSGPPVDNNRIIAADRYIPGILETGINSQLGSKEGGEVIIQVSRDVFGYHGRKPLVPKGSRLICDYESPKQVGSTRISLNCKRILMGEHRAEIQELVARVGDQQGRGGITGEVDYRFWEKYGTAIMLSAISATVRLAAATAATNNAESSTGAVAEKGAEELGEKFGEITASILEQTVNLVQIITISQGTRVQVKPGHDWYIPEFGKGDYQ